MFILFKIIVYIFFGWIKSVLKLFVSRQFVQVNCSSSLLYITNIKQISWTWYLFIFLHDNSHVKSQHKTFKKKSLQENCRYFGRKIICILSDWHKNIICISENIETDIFKSTIIIWSSRSASFKNWVIQIYNFFHTIGYVNIVRRVFL